MRKEKRRRGEVVHAHVLMDAAFEVAIAGQHRRDAQLVVTNGLADRLVERARIADAGRAAVGDDVVAKVFEIRSEEHTSELQSLMRISYAVFCLTKKKTSA